MQQSLVLLALFLAAAPGALLPAYAQSQPATGVLQAPPRNAAPENKPTPSTNPPAPTIGAVTNQPLPRWASFRTDEVNLRAGPGTRYPIEWVYRRVGLPVQIEREFEAWRLVTDQDGVKGWVHSATLQGRRGFAVRGKERPLRKSAVDDAAPIALLKPGVVGRIRACEANAIWCEVQVSDYRGWLKRDEIWGVFATEAVK